VRFGKIPLPISVAVVFLIITLAACSIFPGRKIEPRSFTLSNEASQHIGQLVWPVRTAEVSSTFGGRWSGFHEGLDLGAPKGTPIYAAHDGEVVSSGSGLNGYGNMVVLKGRGVLTVYAHNSKNLVKAGDIVRRGDQIAEVGQTGNASGPHCHFEVRVLDSDGAYVAVNPYSFYPSAGSS